MLKKIYLQTLSIFFIVVALQTTVQAQRIDSLLNVLDENYPQEKVHLHLDKSAYTPGETIWFKAYLTADNLPACISKNCYADLIDENGNLLQRKVMAILESGAASFFDLPSTLRANKLFIRSYTSWMMNFDSSLFYLEPITILQQKSTAKKAAVLPTYTLTLFPEGGDLVQGLNAMVAFKANDQDGTPISVSGNIVDDQQQIITPFSAEHDGMGYFSLTPKAGNHYKAIWKDKAGVQHSTDLPDVKANGVALSVIISPHQITYTLSRPDNNLPAANNVFYVVAQMHQRMMYSAMVKLTKQTTATAPILTDSMPNGVLQLTIFNAAQQPIAERLVFVNNHNYYFNTDLHAVEKSMAKRGKNVLQIDVANNITSNLSIAVTDASINPIGKNESNIYTQLLLSSDLKGYVYNPAYYFASEEDSVSQHLDLVMMTNGWRRFTWTDLLAEKWPVITLKPENYLSIKGQVLGLSKLKLNGRQLNCILKPKKGTSEFVSIPVDANGQFKLENLYFFDTAKLFYQFNGDKDKSLTTSATFNISSSFTKQPPVSVNLLSSLYAPAPMDSSILFKTAAIAQLQLAQIEKNKVQTLSTVVIKSKQKSLKEKLDDEYASGFFSGGDGYTFAMDEDPFAKSALNILSYLQGKVAGLEISPDDQEGGAKWRGHKTSFFLNEVSTEVDQLQSISMADVAMIKIFRPPFFGASGGGAGGAIAVYTKKGADLTASVKGLDFTNLAGYSAIKQFYSPNYETTNDPTVADYRTTLYWNSFILMDKTNRRVLIPFYNNDNCKKMRVVIEGINELGQLTREEKIFE